MIKGLQTLPGIKTHSDGSAFFYVRGGDRDQNLIIIDDAPIFNPAHLFGFYSMVIPEATKEIKVYKSDIPANLGDRLSSIVSIRTKDGNLNKWSFSGSLNPLVNRFALEIPVIKEKASIYTSIRRSNFEWLYQNNNPDLDLAFGDFNFKWNSKVGRKDRLYFTIITGTDVLADLASSSGISWANVATTLRWNHLFGPRLFLNTTLYSGSYNYRLSLQNNSWESGIGTISLKTDFNHYINPGLKANFGLEVAAYGFNPGRISEGNLLSIFPEINQRITQKRTVYYQIEKLSRKWQWSAGIRMPSWSNVGPAEYFTFDEDYQVRDIITQPEGFYNTYVRLDPRASIRYSIDSTSHLKLSLGRYHQFLQLISNSVSPFTALEVWLPSGPNIKPQSAVQFDLDYIKYFPRPRLSLLLGLYYKSLTNQVDYVGHANTVLNPRLEGELRFGEMKAYGFEFLLEKEVGKLRGALSYTFSRAIRQTPALNNGREYPAFQDRPHDVSLMINYQVSDRFLFSAYWTAFSGSAFSSPTGFYQFRNQTIPIYDNLNNDRLPGYQRLDLSFTYRLHRNPVNRFQHSLGFSVFNALAHKNIIAIDFNKVSEEGKPVIPVNFVSDRDLVSSRTDLIRFFPSLTYKFKI
ncbi:MAG: TonB-dependent receptor plug domain-containing protein [Saprospiraceae bacterium]|nr:TonB-dependent receptor plug domain-containing protein [Saprospiraceae bacterium]